MHEKETSFVERKLKFKSDYLARQANGSVVATYGETMVLATAVIAGSKEGLDYFPLMVDYEEKLYAAGKIKGSRFIKREGRASDDAILTSRLIDRGIRPLFDEGIRNEVQVVVTVLSLDEENPPDILACNAASAAIMASDIPWAGPLATVRVGRVDGEFVANPTYIQKAKSDLDLVISSTGDSIMMVEAGANEVSEADMVGAMKFAEKYIDELIAFQNELTKEVGKPKTEVEYFKPREEIVKLAEGYKTKLDEALYGHTKQTRQQNTDLVKEAFFAEAEDKYPESENEAKLAFEKLMKNIIRRNILEKERRIDERKLDETREVTAEVGILPRTHGSALFQRGETQVLTIVTLAGPGAEQIMDAMEDFTETTKRYIHHYNFPPFSVGEVKFMRGPGRREIGHGALAERALLSVIPNREDFSYTIRLVSEALGSNGSTSMASTCGSSLALMDAGVPIKKAIGGVAMGLVIDEESGNFKVLTDIQGIEDGNGDMDFKVTGSETGITALQMDVKTRGLTVDILAQALTQAKEGRLHILSIMNKCIPASRAELSKYAPRIISFKIDPEKIGTVIGGGGKTIQEITSTTNTEIDIDDDGLISITSQEAENAQKAEQWIKDLVREVKAGEEFTGKVTRLMDFGVFVEVLPGKEGLVHISKLSPGRVEKVSDVVKEGDTLEVVVTEIDFQGRINLATKEAYESGKTSGERRERNGNGGGRARNDRRGPRR